MKDGIHDGLPDVDYFDDPALSQSGAKLLLKAPALYKWRLDNPRPDTDAFDLGHAAHAKVLGVGAPVAVIDATDKRGKKWSEPADEARAEGKVPLLRKDADAVDAMAESVLAHPLARAILESEGRAEQSLFWTDEETGIDCRGRIDWLTTTTDGQPFLADLKTTVSAAPDDFGRSVHTYGYGLQDRWYTTGLRAATGQDPAFAFICVEKDPPHLVTVGAIDDTARDIGERQMRDALDLYRRCVDTDEWPAYGTEFITYPSPRWAR